MSLTQAAYFYALKDIKPTATARVSGNTPKASHLEPEQRVVPLFLIVLNLSVMSNEEFERKQTEQKAAHMLMVEFVKNHAELMATVLEPIVATWGEVTYPSLKDNMGVVSQVFAGLALQLIDHNSSLDPEDTDNMILPCGAKTMHSTLEELSRFIEGTRQLMWTIGDKHYDDPAIKLVRETFFEYDTQM